MRSASKSQNSCLPCAEAVIITVSSSSAAEAAKRPCGLVTRTRRPAKL